MNFIGYDYYSDINSLVPNSNPSVLSSIILSNGIYDDFYLSKDPDEYKSGNSLWNGSTLISSDYNNQDLVGGNLPYILGDIIALRLKRREVGTFEWTGLYEHPVTDLEHVNFTYIDRYARGRETEYEYCIVPVTQDGIEQSYNIITIISDFSGAVISDRDSSYHILLEPSVVSTTKNRDVSVITTMNNKYPFVFYGSDANYYSGSFSGVAIKYDNDTYFDLKGSVHYRDEMLEWLTNGQPKILKMFDGRIWMINVNGGVTSDCSEHYDKVKVSFDFVEIGDSTNTEDLYNNNFTDYTV